MNNDFKYGLLGHELTPPRPTRRPVVNGHGLRYGSRGCTSSPQGHVKVDTVYPVTLDFR